MQGRGEKKDDNKNNNNDKKDATSGNDGNVDNHYIDTDDDIRMIFLLVKDISDNEEKVWMGMNTIAVQVKYLTASDYTFSRNTRNFEEDIIETV